MSKKVYDGAVVLFGEGDSNRTLIHLHLDQLKDAELVCDLYAQLCEERFCQNHPSHSDQPHSLIIFDILHNDLEMLHNEELLYFQVSYELSQSLRRAPEVSSPLPRYLR